MSKDSSPILYSGRVSLYTEFHEWLPEGGGGAEVRVSVLCESEKFE